jgi:hypothetical protein
LVIPQEDEEKTCDCKSENKDCCCNSKKEE